MTNTKDVRTRTEVKELMWEYYRDNKVSIPKWIQECREEIIESLMTGTCVVETFGSFNQTVECDTTA